MRISKQRGFWLCITAAFTIVLIVCFQKALNRPSSLAVQPVPIAVTDPSTQGTAQSLISTQRLVWSSPIPNDPEPKYTRWFLEASKKDPKIEWKAPIDFWGMVLDDQDQPVEGVAVGFVWNDLSAMGTSQHATTTDNQGRFNLLNRRGKGLSINITKDGYHRMPGHSYGSYEYASPWGGNRFHPDSNNPVVFRLKKAGVAEPLVVGLRFTTQATNVPPLRFDLVENRRVNAEGDLVVDFWREPRQRGTNAMWKVTLSVPSGGIQEYTNRVEFTAPEGGYHPDISYAFEPETQTWTPSVTKLLFLKLREGRVYGRIEIQLLGVWNDESAADLRSFVNPKGSRNLEFDPKLQPLPPQW